MCQYYLTNKNDRSWQIIQLSIIPGAPLPSLLYKDQTMRVLISGAGVAGPTLAWFLAKTGASITVVEKGQDILPHGQNVDLKGTAVTVIKKMGLLDRVRQSNTTEKGTQFIDSKGDPFASFPVKEGFSVSLSSEFEILRGDLAAILYEASRECPEVKYLFGTTIKEVISNDNDTVAVKFSHGKVKEFDLLVAADGQWSKVRQQCFPTECVNVIDKGMYAVYWTVPRLPSDNDWWNIYVALRSRIITLRPDPYGTIRAMFTRMPCSEDEEMAWLEATKNGKQAQQELIRKDFADAGWQSQRLLNDLEHAPDFYFQVLQQIKMSKWSNKRVVCVGDAAYAPTPVAGGGTSLAIIGAYILAGELSKLDEHEHPSKALEAYENTYRPFVEEAQKIPSFVPAIAHPKTAWRRLLLQYGLWTLSKVLSVIAAIPRLASNFEQNSKDDFPLPYYPKLDIKTSQIATSS
jgi:2-polyprenyl-6-methoxyphenol hydroxylase-like FAD-dependent oxidoreductase